MPFIDLTFQIILYVGALAIILIFFAGVNALYQDYCNWKDEKKYGAYRRTRQQETERNNMIAVIRSDEHIRLLEQALRSVGQVDRISEISNVVHTKDYSDEYQAWRKEYNRKWRESFYAVPKEETTLQRLSGHEKDSEDFPGKEDIR